MAYLRNFLYGMILFGLTACYSAQAEDSDSSTLSARNTQDIITGAQVTTCGQQGIWLQILGSGGPELNDKRASSAYLIWVDGQSRVLVDAGTGAARNFEQAGADFAALDAVLLSHLHVDHSADLPALIKGSYFTQRQRNLPVFGPDGNRLMPDTKSFVNALFAADHGAYRYLDNYLEDSKQSSSYRIEARVYSEPYALTQNIGVSAIGVQHGPIPALAWRVDIQLPDGQQKSLAFSGDMASGGQAFIEHIQDVDVFIAHHAIPEKAHPIARNLHMPPSVIADYANKAKVKHLLLSHHMLRSLAKLDESRKIIQSVYAGPVHIAEDMLCIKL